jgi:hypothetical protein
MRKETSQTSKQTHYYIYIYILYIKRGLLCVTRDQLALAYVKRDLLYVKRGLIYVKRDQLATPCLNYAKNMEKQTYYISKETCYISKETCQD